jgi:predicted RNA-binding Zn ribbon-like protein
MASGVAALARRRDRQEHHNTEAIADLACNADFPLIRACAGPACTLMFLDRTKAHAPRWCSMALHGSRANVATRRA